MTQSLHRMVSLFAVCLLASAGVAAAQSVGTVAAARGAADIGRGGAWTAAAVGGEVQLGDTLRTGDGQLRVVFQDDSVIDLSENSTLVVDQQVFDPGGGRFTSLMKLVTGKARALVGTYYKNPGASYEMETPTAVAGVRGTSFVVAYNPETDATEVIGIRGQIEVRGVGARVGDRVFITAHEGTLVERGGAPTQPERLDEEFFDDRVQGLELLSLGSVGTLAASSPVGAGSSVPAPDQAPSDNGLVGQLGRDELRNFGDVVGQPSEVSSRGSLGVPF